MRYSYLDKEVEIAKLCQLTLDACHFMKKDNRNYPIRKRLLDNKNIFVKWLVEKTPHCAKIQHYWNFRLNLPYGNLLLY